MNLFICMLRARVLVSGLLLLASSFTAAQVIEDHSLPKSVVKTYHVKCNGGRLAVIRYDIRQEPTRLCAVVQDVSRPRQCESVSRSALQPRISAMAAAACQ